MAWQDTLLDASFRGFVFDLLNEHYGGGHRVCRHAYPYKDGADVEDMGLEPRRFDMTAVLWGDDYETRLQDFIRLLEQRGRGELVHPIYGSLPETQAVRWEVSHDADRPDYAEIKLSFEQAVPSAPFFDRELPAMLADELDWLSDKAVWQGFETLNRAAEGIRAVQGRWNAYGALARRLLNVFAGQLRGIVYGTLGLTDSPRHLLESFYNLFDESRQAVSRSRYSPAAWKSLHADHRRCLAQIAEVSRGTLKTADGQALFKSCLPAQDTLVLAATVSLAATAVEVQLAADMFAVELRNPQMTPPDIETVANDVRDSIARTLAVCRAAAVLSETERNHASLQTLARAAENSLRLFASDAADDGSAGRTLTPADIYGRLAADGIEWPERSLAEMAATDDIWRDTAAKVLKQATALINLRPPLIRRTVEADGCLRLIAFRWYGDHGRAPELLRLNPHIRHPNFIRKGDTLNAYAR